MKFIRKNGGLALQSKKRGILGFVMKATNGKFLFMLARKQTISSLDVYDDEEAAKAALMEAVR